MTIIAAGCFRGNACRFRGARSSSLGGPDARLITIGELDDFKCTL
jgi:hypothetical protein